MKVKSVHHTHAHTYHTRVSDQRRRTLPPPRQPLCLDLADGYEEERENERHVETTEKNSIEKSEKEEKKGGERGREEGKGVSTKEERERDHSCREKYGEEEGGARFEGEDVKGMVVRRCLGVEEIEAFCEVEICYE